MRLTRSVRLACLAALLAPAPSIRAADQAPGWAAAAIGIARESFTGRSRVPGGYDRGELERLLLPDPTQAGDGKVEVPWLLLVERWKASPGLSVAVLETVTYRKAEVGRGADDDATTLYVAVFAGGASGTRAAVRASCRVAGVPGRHLRALDLARYRLAPDQLAFGVRTGMSWTLAGGGGDNEYLLLFVPRGRELKTVWATLMRSWRMFNDGVGEDGSSSKAEAGDEASATIAVRETATGGLRDLRKALGARSATYRWNGTRYVTGGKDPVENVNGFPGAEVE